MIRIVDILKKAGESNKPDPKRDRSAVQFSEDAIDRAVRSVRESLALMPPGGDGILSQAAKKAAVVRTIGADAGYDKAGLEALMLLTIIREVEAWSQKEGGRVDASPLKALAQSAENKIDRKDLEKIAETAEIFMSAQAE